MLDEEERRRQARNRLAAQLNDALTLKIAQQ